MIRPDIKNNMIFFFLTSIIWVLFILVLYGDYDYFGRPKQSAVKKVSVQKEFNKKGAMLNVTKELYLSLLQKEKRSSERAHIYHNIGAIYFDMYKATGMQRVFDSTYHYFLKSTKALPDNKRFNDDFIRLYQVKNEFDHVRRKDGSGD